MYYELLEVSRIWSSHLHRPHTIKVKNIEGGSQKNVKGNFFFIYQRISLILKYYYKHITIYTIFTPRSKFENTDFAKSLRGYFCLFIQDPEERYKIQDHGNSEFIHKREDGVHDPQWELPLWRVLQHVHWR